MSLLRSARAFHQRHAYAALGVAILAFVVYNANLRLIEAGDTFPARYLPLAIWRTGTLHLDLFTLQLRWIQRSGSKAEVAVPAARRRIRSTRLAWSLAAAAIVAAIVLAAGFFARTPKPSSPVHFSVETPPKTSLLPFDEKGIAISPDGSTLAFVVAGEDGRRMLYVRPLASAEARAMSGTDDAAYPFWSPDSRQIAFFARGKLRRIEVGGGPSQEICDAPLGRGATWSRDGVIVFAPTNTSPLYRVAMSVCLAATIAHPENASGYEELLAAIKRVA